MCDKMFADKVVLVTGSSNGIGAAIAIEYAKKGAQVAIAGRAVEALQKVADEIKSVSQKEALQIIGDISEESVQQKLINETVAKFGKLDILVNNAGIISPFDQIDNAQVLEGFDKVYAVNVRAPINLMHLAAPHLEKTKGNIVNISSIAAQSPMMPIYCSSKSALDMICKCVALQLAPKGIRVNNVSPGPVESAIMRNVGVDPSAGKSIFEKYGELVPLKFMAVGKDIANMVLFLSNNEYSRNITGSIVVSDSGMLLDIGCVREAMAEMQSAANQEKK